jgi:hypothetical protein
MQAQDLKTTFKLISKQSGIDDFLLIEKTFYECNSNELATIFKLMGKDLPRIRGVKLENEKTVFDDIRKICDDKDIIFQQQLKVLKG